MEMWPDRFVFRSLLKEDIFFVTHATLASVARALLLRPSLRLTPHIPT